MKYQMTGPPHLLNEKRRSIVLTTIQQICQHRSWQLLATHVRTNHIRIVREAKVPPEQALNTLNSYARQDTFEATPKCNKQSITQ
jgi:REP element-mobilizing transposase RayT